MGKLSHIFIVYFGLYNWNDLIRHRQGVKFYTTKLLGAHDVCVQKPMTPVWRRYDVEPVLAKRVMTSCRRPWRHNRKWRSRSIASSWSRCRWNVVTETVTKRKSFWFLEWDEVVTNAGKYVINAIETVAVFGLYCKSLELLSSSCIARSPPPLQAYSVRMQQ